MVLSAVFGSSVPEIAPEDVADLSIPRLGEAEDEVADRVERASSLRIEASELEDATGHLMEQAIESHLTDRGVPAT
ncbi:MAG: hypothetical protein OXF01_12630 [Gemmatimonadetes bacterium]|nr:hypothetical protein [Gemmatimonadota bacterium]